MTVARTPDDRFADLPGFPYEPHYVSVPGPGDVELRMHYVDEGPGDAPAVLLLHGQPTWSYLWRHVIGALSARDHRVIAPDHIGFGRSDKLMSRFDYTYGRHIDWLYGLVTQLDLQGATLVAQDWGGPIGLGVLAREPERFARVVAANTILHTCEDPGSEVAWVNAAINDHQVLHEAGLLDYIMLTQRAPVFDPSLIVRFATMSEPSPDVLAAYDAPFPDESYKAGVRQFPVLIPLTPHDTGAAIGRATWEALEAWDRPFLTAFGDQDHATAGWDAVFQRRVPGAAGRRHVRIEGAGHFIPEDAGHELAEVIDAFVEEG